MRISLLLKKSIAERVRMGTDVKLMIDKENCLLGVIEVDSPTGHDFHT